MWSFSKRIYFLVILFIGTNLELCACQDVSTFLGQLMKNYVAKNTKYYTIVNGIPVHESQDGPPDNSEILSRISSILPEPIANAPVLSQILEQDANSFPNSWTPMMAQMEGPPSSRPTLGRRYGHGLEALHFPGPHESKIITFEDIPKEFNIQSSMTY